MALRPIPSEVNTSELDTPEVGTSELDTELDDNTWAVHVHIAGRSATVLKPPLRGQDGTRPARLESKSHLETKYDH